MIVAQPNPGDRTRNEAHRHLNETAKRLTDTLVHSALAVETR